MSEITDVIERRILEVVKEAGPEGIIQREIWVKLSIDSRRGHRILKYLEAQGYIKREPITYRGRKTYLVKPASKLFQRIELPPELDSIPCFYCEHLSQCSGGYRSPLECKKLYSWLYGKEKAEAAEVEVTAKVDIKR